MKEIFKRDKFDFVIIGGGYTALSICINLIDKGFKVLIIEKTNYLGGLGKSLTLSNGSKCESFYHHFFTHDSELINYCKRFLKKSPHFKESKMSIFYKRRFYSWNGIIDLMRYPYLNLFEKLRFIFVTIMLSKGLIKKSFLDNCSLSKGLKRLYGEKAFKSVWSPMIRGKFGDKSDLIPLRWMEGRLKQRLKSRKNGKEKLGFIEGSLFELTEEIKKYILQKGSCIKLNSLILNIYSDSQKKKISLSSLEKDVVKARNFIFNNLVITTSTKSANYLVKNLNPETLWQSHEYFSAYCVLIEMKQSLSNYYWTNIADKDLFFCGYIEQTRLTGIKEYGGLHLGYLTKYVYLNENIKSLSKKKLEEKAKFALKKMFPKKDIEKIILKLHVSISRNAQVVTDFDFKKPKMNMLKNEKIFLANMSNVYPDERSINNAIKVGNALSKDIK